MKYAEFAATTKQRRRELAKAHDKEMRSSYGHEIEECVKSTVVYGPDAPVVFPLERQTEFHLTANDTVAEIFNDYGGNCCVLNFASYINPGGGYLSGSRAQEECLCHSSALYPVLERFRYSYYAWNREHMNKGMYCDRALYTPDVPFVNGDVVTFCDVLTCAAPNYGVGLRYASFGLMENIKALSQRIKFLLSVAAMNRCDTLILGAFGCGAFLNDPAEVARIFAEELQSNFRGCFKNVVFAIPEPSGLNYKTFESVFKEQGLLRKH